MVASLSWAGNSSESKLKIVFNDPVEKSNFFNEVTTEAKKLGLIFPLLEGGPNTLLIDTSKFPAGNPCGCYTSPGGKLAINFGKVQLRDFVLSRLGVKSELAEIPGQHNTIFFHQAILKGIGSELTFPKPSAPKASTTASMINKLPQQTPPAAVSPTSAEHPTKTNNSLKVSGSVDNVKLNINFTNKEAQQSFYKKMLDKANALGIKTASLPFELQEPNSILIKQSQYPANPLGVYMSKKNEIAINLGNTEFRNFILDTLDIDSKLGLKPDKHQPGQETFYFNPQNLSFNKSELSLPEKNAPATPQHSAPKLATPAPVQSAPKPTTPVSNDTTLKAVGAPGKPSLQVIFPNKEKLHTFLTNVTNKAKTLNINSEVLFDIQEPNTLIINPSNWPDQKTGCFISKNNEVAINFGNNAFRDFVLSQLDVDTNYGVKPVGNETGNDSFYFNNKLTLNGGALTIKKSQPFNFEVVMNKTRSFIWNEFLRKPYNNEFRQPPDKETMAAWEKHMGPPDKWEHWSNMGQDWSMTISAGTVVQRPNHGLPHTLRVAELVPVIAEFLKEFGEDKFKQLTEKDIQKAQFMMLFSVIGRENDMSWTDANHLQQAYREAHNGKQSEHLYAKFKANAEKGFLDFVNANKNDLIPSLFADEKEVKMWAQALDTGKPGISSPAGILMAVAHDMDLMRCYDSSKFENLKMKDLTTKLGGNREAAEKIATYANNLILATGDRCMGYGKKQSYNSQVFGKCSLDTTECMQRIQSVSKPTAKVSAGLKL